MKRIITHNLLKSASTYPDRLAFKQLKAEITFEELVAKSNQIARYLIDNGTKKGDRVGVFMNRSIESSFAIYGIMMAGAAFVPIDSSLPTQRVLTLIMDCDIRTIITKPTFKRNIAGVLDAKSSLETVIGLSNSEFGDKICVSWSEIFSLSSRSVDLIYKEDDIAYIIYTSGTTGNPKGIVHTHYSGASYAKLSAELYDLSNEDILGNHSHLHFDISTMGYLTMPYIGGCTVVVPEAHTKFPTSLAKLIEDERMTVWYSVPLALIQLMQNGGFSERDLSSLRWILFGGESFALKHVNALRQSLPNAKFSNVYGPAEVNQCTYYNFDKNIQLSEPIPLGHAWPETDVKIIGNDMTKSGELIVASSTQMRGYWNRPEKTANSFISQEDRNGQIRRYYKTNDIGYINSANELVFGGRRDRQIKIRGHRVELNEIESLLLQLETIQDVAVYAQIEEDANVIYAYVTTSGGEVDEVIIKKYLSDYLPRYSIPQSIQIIDQIPRTTAGKIDYKVLQQ